MESVSLVESILAQHSIENGSFAEWIETQPHLIKTIHDQISKYVTSPLLSEEDAESRPEIVDEITPDKSVAFMSIEKRHDEMVKTVLKKQEEIKKLRQELQDIEKYKMT